MSNMQVNLEIKVVLMYLVRSDNEVRRHRNRNLSLNKFEYRIQVVNFSKIPNFTLKFVHYPKTNMITICLFPLDKTSSWTYCAVGNSSMPRHYKAAIQWTDDRNFSWERLKFCNTPTASTWEALFQ